MSERFPYLRKKAAQLPLSPGVYIMHDRFGKIIYVGKSRALKNRVSQYFQDNASHDIKTQKMANSVYDFEYILCNTEMEALTLENNLIKLHTPHYNIRLKDDKYYPFLKITVNDKYPRLLLARRRLDDKAKYFGPYSSAAAVKMIIDTLQKSFRIPSCTKKFPQEIGKTRPCIYYQMNQCCGVCANRISYEDYRKIFSDIVSLLSTSPQNAKKELLEQMNYAAENEMFEAAAIYRDRMKAFDAFLQKQKVLDAPNINQDVISLWHDGDIGAICVFYIRDGLLNDSERFIIYGNQICSDETLVSFISELYTRREYIPKKIILGFKLQDEDLSLLTEYLTDKKGSKVEISTPVRGKQRQLATLCAENAEQYAKEYKATEENDEKVLIKLASLAKLEVVPKKIEAYDISNFGSDNIICGKITYENAKPNKKNYRLYNIKSTETPDDYASMREAIERRLAHEDDPLPDLFLLDGGAGHVSTIQKLFDEKNIRIPILGMVKDEHHKTRTLISPDGEISIANEQSVFMLIYKIQDEVHRFTITKMKSQKTRKMLTSSLEKIKGIGNTKARALLLHFDSFEDIKKASIEELSAVKGISKRDAENIYTHFTEEKIK